MGGVGTRSGCLTTGSQKLGGREWRGGKSPLIAEAEPREPPIGIGNGMLLEEFGGVQKFEGIELIDGNPFATGRGLGAKFGETPNCCSCRASAAAPALKDDGDADCDRIGCIMLLKNGVGVGDCNGASGGRRSGKGAGKEIGCGFIRGKNSDADDEDAGRPCACSGSGIGTGAVGWECAVCCWSCSRRRLVSG
jgi:hypothetical protein